MHNMLTSPTPCSCQEFNRDGGAWLYWYIWVPFCAILSTDSAVMKHSKCIGCIIVSTHAMLSRPSNILFPREREHTAPLRMAKERVGPYSFRPTAPSTAYLHSCCTPRRLRLRPTGNLVRYQVGRQTQKFEMEYCLLRPPGAWSPVSLDINALCVAFCFHSIPHSLPRSMLVTV